MAFKEKQEIDVKNAGSHLDTIVSMNNKESAAKANKDRLSRDIERYNGKLYQTDDAGKNAYVIFLDKRHTHLKAWRLYRVYVDDTININNAATAILTIIQEFVSENGPVYFYWRKSGGKGFNDRMGQIFRRLATIGGVRVKTTTLSNATLWEFS